MFYMLCAALKARPRGFVLIMILLVMGLILWWFASVLVDHLHGNGSGFSVRTNVILDNEEIQDFTKSLYELEENAEYLLNVNFQGDFKSTQNQSNYMEKPFIELKSAINQTSNLMEDHRNNITILLQNLYKNYDTEMNKSLKKLQNEWYFLLMILFTPIMQETMNFLSKNDVISRYKLDQVRLLHEIWFSSRLKSSKVNGFQKVFLSPRNWLYFAEQERLGYLQYKGYTKKLSLEKKNQFVAEINFTYSTNASESQSIMLIGTSPEFEMSLYTLCFLVHPDSVCPVQFGGVSLKLRVKRAKDSLEQNQRSNVIESVSWSFQNMSALF